MNAINELTEKMNAINELTGRTKEFATACYQDNSIEELLDCQLIDADPTDCKEWGITPDDWHEAIDAALQEKLDEAI